MNDTTDGQIEKSAADQKENNTNDNGPELINGEPSIEAITIAKINSGINIDHQLVLNQQIPDFNDRFYMELALQILLEIEIICKKEKSEILNAVMMIFGQKGILRRIQKIKEHPYYPEENDELKKALQALDQTDGVNPSFLYSFLLHLIEVEKNLITSVRRIKENKEKPYITIEGDISSDFENNTYTVLRLFQDEDDDFPEKMEKLKELSDETSEINHKTLVQKTKAAKPTLMSLPFYDDGKSIESEYLIDIYILERMLSKIIQKLGKDIPQPELQTKAKVETEKIIDGEFQDQTLLCQILNVINYLVVHRRDKIAGPLGPVINPNDPSSKDYFTETDRLNANINALALSLRTHEITLILMNLLTPYWYKQSK